MRLRPWQEIGDRIILGAVFFVVIVWAAYFWERSTGLTWATRYHSGEGSTPAHLAKTLHQAIGITAFCVPIAALYFGVLRRR